MGYLIIRLSHSLAKSSPVLYQFVITVHVTATLIGHILIKSSQEVSQCDVIELDISDQDLMYYTEEMFLFKHSKPNEISIRSIKN